MYTVSGTSNTKFVKNSAIDLAPTNSVLCPSVSIWLISLFYINFIQLIILEYLQY